MGANGQTLIPRDAWIMLGLGLLAFVLRLGLLCQYAHSPYFFPLGWDPKAYDLWAQDIVAGQWAVPEAFHQPPLYPYWLAGLYALVGRDFFLIFALQGLMDSLSCVLLFRLGRDGFNRAVGVLAGLGWCFHTLGAMYSVKLLSETPFVLLVLALVTALQAATRRATALRWAGCGALLGMSMLAKPNMLLFLPVVWLHLALNGTAPWRRRLRDGALLMAAAGLMLAPVLIHNARAEDGRFIFVSWNGGGNLYSGNSPGAIGLPEPLPGVSQDRLWRPVDERLVVGRALGIAHPSAGVVSAYWSGLARTWMREHSAAFARLLWSKFRLAISGMENAHMYYAAHERERFTPRLGWFPLNFYLLFPPAAAGLLLALPAWRRHLLLYAAAAVPFATMLIFYVLTRFRLPAEPFLLLFAGHALTQLRPGAPQAPRALGLLAVFALCSSAMFLADRHRFPGRATIIESNLGELQFANGQLAEAEATYWRAAAMDPQNLYPALGLCKVMLARHRPDLAARAYEAVAPFADADFHRDALRDEDLITLRPVIQRALLRSAPTRDAQM